MTAIELIPIARIKAGDNDRKHFADEGIASLADSIAKLGLIQPITVRPRGTGYEIIAGERRFRALQLLNETEAACIVREADDSQAAAAMLAENLTRIDLDPVEEAMAYRRRMVDFNLSLETVATESSVTPQRVRGRLKLLELTSDAQHLVRLGQLPLGHAALMSQLDVNRQALALRFFNERNPILDDFRAVCGKLLADQQQESMFDFDLFLQTVNDSTPPVDAKLEGIPHAADLPEPEVRRSTPEMMECYIVALREAGKDREADVVGTVYRHMVEHYYTTRPRVSPLLASEKSE